MFSNLASRTSVRTGNQAKHARDVCTFILMRNDDQPTYFQRFHSHIYFIKFNFELIGDLDHRKPSHVQAMDMFSECDILMTSTEASLANEEFMSGVSISLSSRN